jgi:hypothetical protein
MDWRCSSSCRASLYKHKALSSNPSPIKKKKNQLSNWPSVFTGSESMDSTNCGLKLREGKNAPKWDMCIFVIIPIQYNNHYTAFTYVKYHK